MMAMRNPSRLVRLVITIVCLAASTTSSCGNNDLQALLKLKSTVMRRLPPYYSGFWEWDPEKYHTNDSSALHCSFSGVTCNSDSQVVALDISYRFLYGSIPGDIGLLTHLVNLTITNDAVVTGPLPVEMAKLTSLKLLNLSHNGLNGSFPEEIASGMTQLQVLDVSRNKFTGSLPAVGIAAMKNLRYLNLQQNRFSGRISPGIWNLTKLESMLFDENQLSGEIPHELCNLKSLSTLGMSSNSLSGNIPSCIVKCRSLIELDLSGNQLSGQIPELVSDLLNLEVLQLQGNNFSSELPKNLGQNRKLKQVDVSWNHLMGSIPRDLCKGGVLESLILDNNYLTGLLPQELGRCKSLTIIQVSYNLLNGTIPAGIFQLPSANLIKLDNNLFSGQLPSFMWTGEFSRLVLSNNRITGRIPPAIGNLTKLRFLLLDGNLLSNEIPQELCNLQFLSEVNISSNDITGNIPSCLGKFSYLTILDLSRNHLSGQIPEFVGYFEQLQLSHNNLTGQIPCSLVNGTNKFFSVDHSYNELSGEVPIQSPLSFSGNPNLSFSARPECFPLVQEIVKGHSNHSNSVIIITIVIILWTGFCLLIAATLVVLVRKKRKQLVADEPMRPWTITNFQKLPEDLKQEDILDCLTEENIIGKGGAGVVYLGSIPGDVKVAIKQPIKRSSQRDNSFAAEVRTLGQIRHKHIVKLLGHVSNSDRSTTLLLYEYMPNGSLAEALHGPNGGSLSWEMRYKIAVEAAMGLSYLHHDCSPPIIHRDIKPHNILLDSSLEAHIADFGLSKLWHHRRPLPPESSYHMSVVAGTFGYLAPEYAYTLKVDEKIDVYSYGVVMLELISGRKAVGGFDEGVNIVMWVRELASKFVGKTNADVAESVVLEILDQRLVQQPHDVASATHMLKIAMMCVDTRSSARPTMREVLHLLTNHQTWNMIISPDHET